MRRKNTDERKNAPEDRNRLPKSVHVTPANPADFGTKPSPVRERLCQKMERNARGLEPEEPADRPDR